MDRANKQCSKTTSPIKLEIACIMMVSLFIIHITTDTRGTANAVGAAAAITCNVKTYGATGNGTTRDTAAIQRAIDACGGGGTVIFPKGKYLTAPLFLLKSNITLNIMNGATILASETLSDYIKGTQKVATPVLALINSYHVNDITITGGGTIDGQDVLWWSLGKSTSNSPRLVVLAYGDNIKVNNITLQNAATMHLLLKSTSNVVIDGVTIRSSATPSSTGGMVSSSSNSVLINNCDVSIGDGNIATMLVPTDSIEVVTCKLGNEHLAGLLSINTGVKSERSKKRVDKVQAKKEAAKKEAAKKAAAKKEVRKASHCHKNCQCK